MLSTPVFRRPLLVVAAALACGSAVPAAEAAGTAAATKSAACKPGELQVRVSVATKAKRGGKAKTATALRCRRPLAGGEAKDGAALLRAAIPTPKQVRAALPSRVRARFPVAKLQRVDRALAKRAATGVAARAAASRSRPARTPVRAHAAGAGDCSGPSTPAAKGYTSQIDGVPVTGTGGHWGGDGGATSGTEMTLRADLLPGASKTRRTKDCISWDTCPDADGVVTGRYVWTFEESMTGEAGGMKATVSVSYEVEAKLTAHVGGDGRVTTFDWDGAGTSRTRIQVWGAGKMKHVPRSDIRSVVHGTGADPRRDGKSAATPTFRVWGPNSSVLNGDAANDYDIAEGLLIEQIFNLPKKASKPLLAAEKVWYDDAACLDVVFDPQPAAATPNAKIPVKVNVRAKDGADVGATYDAQPVDGAVGPPTGTTPATVTWTAPAQVDDGTFPTFKVVALSNRGRAVGTHTARGPEKGKWWTLTYTGRGDYHRHEPRGIPYPQLWSDHTYAFTMVSLPLRIPYVDALPQQRLITSSASVALTGELHGKRVDGGGTDTCAAVAEDDNMVGQVAVQGGGDGFDLSVTPFQLLMPPLGTDCGTFEDMLHSAPGFSDGLRADTHVRRADLDTKDRIELAVKSGPTLTADCRGGAANGGWPCTHTMAWEGTIVLQRAPTPAGER